VDEDHQSILAERLKDIRVSPRTWSRTGRTFVELPGALPFSNFDLHLPAPEMYETPEVIRFRRRFGPHIGQLDVYSFGKCKLEGEWDFFESLVNLELLTIHKITTRPYDSTPSTPPRIPHSSIQNDYRENATITENFPDWIEFVRRLLVQSSPEMKLGNVTPAMLVSLKDEPDELQRRFADRIVSIQSFKWSMRNFELPNLEELLGFDSVPKPIIDDGSVHPQWPKLNKLTTDKFTNRVS
jgi:hypothetical protein